MEKLWKKRRKEDIGRYVGGWGGGTESVLLAKSITFALPGSPHLHNKLTPCVSGSLERQTAGQRRHTPVTSLLPSETSMRHRYKIDE